MICPRFFLRAPLPAQYPSIIRAHNLCYSTIVLDDSGGAPGETEYEVVQTGMGTFKFAQSPRGVVPSMLEDLAVFRKRAKRDMAAAEAAGDAWAASLANAKQLAYKITMNSVYGFLGATKGMLPCVPIAASVTAIGRGMIQQTKRLVETLVPGSIVVYGDTDSVMVKLELGNDKRHDMHAHFELAAKVAAEISKTFKPPNELEFEKVCGGGGRRGTRATTRERQHESDQRVALAADPWPCPQCYYPYLLFSKKRYAGAVFFCERTSQRRE